MRVKCLAQEHNTTFPARTRTRTTRSGVEHSNHEATAGVPRAATLSGHEQNSEATNSTDTFICTLYICLFPEFISGDQTWEHVLRKEFIRFLLSFENVEQG